MCLPREIVQIVASYLHNSKKLIHTELHNLSYSFVRMTYLGRMRVVIDDMGMPVNVPHFAHPVFENLPARMHWPPLNMMRV